MKHFNEAERFLDQAAYHGGTSMHEDRVLAALQAIGHALLDLTSEVERINLVLRGPAV